MTEEEISQNKTRFGTQKGISSDEFFGRERFDPAAQSEAKDRLRQFDGATAISSNSYFGRPEDELPPIDDGYGDLEGAAKDFVRRFGITAGDDLENLSQLVGEGAVKLQGGSSACTLLPDTNIRLLTSRFRRYSHLLKQLDGVSDGVFFSSVQVLVQRISGIHGLLDKKPLLPQYYTSTPP